MATGSLSGCLRDNLLKTETSDGWRDEIVWKQNACLERGSGVMDREQALDQLSCVLLRVTAATTRKALPASVAFDTSCTYSPAQTFLIRLGELSQDV